MGRPAIKWAQVVRYCDRHGFTIYSSGGDKIIMPPATAGSGQRSRQTVRIGHKCCSNPGDELYGCYISKLRNVLNIDIDALSQM